MWRAKADEVKARFKEYLWDEERGAAYDRDKYNNPMYVLSLENVKCMYHGIFSQKMADEFIERHLMNPDEFFTPLPLPNIAANDVCFYLNNEKNNFTDEIRETVSKLAAGDMSDNSWGGPCNGLIWQRQIDALLNYGYHKETVIFGKRILDTLKREQKYVQCYNPFTGKAANGENGYGPTILAALEYISVLCGVNIRYGKVLWSAATEMGAFEYTQKMYGKSFTLISDGNEMKGYIDNSLIFTSPVGNRIETDLNGKILNTYSLI
jgi:hypothetical protein